MEERKDFYYVIQEYMVKDLQLSGNDLLVYAIVNGFSQGGCGSFNGSLTYLTTMTNASKRTIQNTLCGLIDRNLIKKEYYSDDCGEKRCRYKIVGGYSKNCTGGIAKIATPTENKEVIQEKVAQKENIQETKNIFIINNNKDYVEETSTASKISVKDVISYLNEKLGTKYKSSSSTNTRHIQARINEGFSLDDFKCVIDKKVSEWKGTQMEKYLRPETLFAGKFEGYLNQTENIKEKSYTNKTKHSVSNIFDMIDSL